MHPILIKFSDNFVIYSYAFFVVIGLFAAVFLFRILCDKRKIDDKTYNFYVLTAIISIAAGFLFAMLFQSLYYFIETGTWSFGALTFMGGLIGGVVCFILITVFFAKPPVRRQFWRIANLISPAILVAHAFGRIGCFMNGCCYGRETESWIGVTFPGETHKVIPTQLIESIFLFLLCAALVVMLLKFKKESWLMLVYLYAYAVFRFILEFYRGDARGQFLGGISPSQWQSIVMLLAAAALTVYIYVFKKIPFAGKPLPEAVSAAAAAEDAPAQASKDTPAPKESLSVIDTAEKDDAEPARIQDAEPSDKR